jgi:hypothetical protein
MTSTPYTSFAALKLQNLKSATSPVSPQPLFNRIPRRTHKIKTLLIGLVVGVSLSIGVAALHPFGKSSAPAAPAANVIQLASAAMHFPAVVTTTVPAASNTGVLGVDGSVLPRG